MALTDADIEIVKTTWEHGFAYVATRLNEMLIERGLRIDVAPPPREVYNLKVAIQRFSNSLILVRPYALDLPQDSELGPWPIGFVNGRNKLVYLAWRDCRDDGELSSLIDFMKSREWSKAELAENVVAPADFYTSIWEEFFDRLRDNVTSTSRSTVPLPVELKAQEWSVPKSPAEWSKLFKVSWDTLKKRFDNGSIRTTKLSTKSYRVHVDDVPK